MATKQNISTITISEGQPELAEKVAREIVFYDLKIFKANGQVNNSRLYRVLLVDKAEQLGLDIESDIHLDDQGKHSSNRSTNIHCAITSVHDDEWIMLAAGITEKDVWSFATELIASNYAPQYQEQMENNLIIVLKTKARGLPYSLNLDYIDVPHVG